MKIGTITFILYDVNEFLPARTVFIYSFGKDCVYKIPTEGNYRILMKSRSLKMKVYIKGKNHISPILLHLHEQSHLCLIRCNSCA